MNEGKPIIYSKENNRSFGNECQFVIISPKINRCPHTMRCMREIVPFQIGRNVRLAKTWIMANHTLLSQWGAKRLEPVQDEQVPVLRGIWSMGSLTWEEVILRQCRKLLIWGHRKGAPNHRVGWFWGSFQEAKKISQSEFKIKSSVVDGMVQWWEAHDREERLAGGEKQHACKTWVVTMWRRNLRGQRLEVGLYGTARAIKKHTREGQ